MHGCRGLFNKNKDKKSFGQRKERLWSYHVTNFKFLFKKRRFDEVKIVESLFQKMFECLF
jgi:hypothetical protein